MARISEKNPRFRTKDAMCKDLSKVLNADLSHGTKVAVLNEIFWVWSEFDGKISGCKYWSKKAKKEYEINKKVKLIHEHIVPREVLRKMIFDMDSPTPKSLKEILSKYCIGVVVTKEEDEALDALGLRSEMPENWDGSDAWARYKMANIILADFGS